MIYAPPSINYIGIRPGEKLHEVLISEDESRQTIELEDMYIVKPSHPWWTEDVWNEGDRLSDGFRYTSDMNNYRLTKDEMKALVEQEL